MITVIGFSGGFRVGGKSAEKSRGTLVLAFTMGGVGVAALLANAASFGLLWAYRAGDANMRSAWICTRNDVLGNLAVPRSACSAPAPAGRMCSSRRLWAASACGAAGRLSIRHAANFAPSAIRRSPAP